jgi:hypothetical protein
VRVLVREGDWAVSGVMWADDGPISQGKILTAVMQDRESDALDMMRRWTMRDLSYLADKAEILSRLARQESDDMWRRS